MLVMHLASDDGARAAGRLASVRSTSGRPTSGSVTSMRGGSGPPARFRPAPAVDDVLAAVDAGTVDLGVVPLEDSHDGLRAETVDGLAFDTAAVVVVGEVDLVRDGVTTRWVAVATEPVADVDDPQTLVFVVPRLNRPGTLMEVLAAFSSRGLNLTRFATRPLHGALGMYGFLLEVEGSPVDEWVADALADVLVAASHVKFLGTFAAGERSWSEVTGLEPAGPALRTLADLDALVARLTGGATA